MYGYQAPIVPVVAACMECPVLQVSVDSHCASVLAVYCSSFTCPEFWGWIYSSAGVCSTGHLLGINVIPLHGINVLQDGGKSVVSQTSSCPTESEVTTVCLAQKQECQHRGVFS